VSSSEWQEKKNEKKSGGPNRALLKSAQYIPKWQVPSLLSKTAYQVKCALFDLNVPLY
jgi:hypothetical protein